MSLGGFSANVVSGGATLTPSADELQRKVIVVDVCTAGTPGTLYAPSGSPAMTSGLGAGPAVGEGAVLFAATGKQVLTPPMFVPVDPTVTGGVGSVTHTGGGAGSVTVSCAPHVAISFAATTGGTIGTMAGVFTVNGVAQAEVTSENNDGGAWSYRVPGTFCTITFPAGTYTGSETASVGVDGSVTSSGAGATAGIVTSAAGPFDLRTLGSPMLRIAFNAGGDQDFTLSATYAEAVNTGAAASFPWSGSIKLKVNGGPEQEITGTLIANNTDLVGTINNNIIDAYAVEDTDAYIRSDRRGTGATIQITGVTNSAGNCGFVTGTTTGSGDCANLGAVTAAEWVAKLSTLTNGTASAVSGALRLTSTTTGTGGTVQVKSASTADTAMGFDNTVHSGSAAGAITGLAQASSPVDNYDMDCEIVTGGALGTATVSPSLDDGNTTLSTQVIPASGVVVVPGTGVVLTFASATYSAGDHFAFPCAAPSHSASDLTDALDAALNDATFPRAGVLLVSSLSPSAADAFTLADTLQAWIDAAKTTNRRYRALINCPYVGDTIISAATAVVDSADTASVIKVARVGKVAPDVDVFIGTHRFQARTRIRRGAALAMAYRVCTTVTSDSAVHRDAPLPVTEIGFDERLAAVSLYDAQLNTLQTVDGLDGVYSSIQRGGYGWRGLTIDANLQDADSVRALNAAIAVVTPVGQKQVGKRFPLNSNGTIEGKARGALSSLFDGVFKRACGIGPSAAYGGVPQASDVSAEVDPSSNLGPTGDKVIRVNGTFQALGLASAVDFTVYYGASA